MNDRRMPRTALVLLVLFAASAATFAEEQIFVQLDSIPGESLDQAHEEWIDAYAFGEEHVLVCSPPAPCNPELGFVTFLKGTDRASAALRTRLLEGTQIPSATIEICTVVTGGLQCDYRIELQQVTVERMSLAGSACTEPANCVPVQTESVALGYRTIRWIWQDPRGGTIEFSWDVEQGGPA